MKLQVGDMQLRPDSDDHNWLRDSVAWCPGPGLSARPVCPWVRPGGRGHPPHVMAGRRSCCYTRLLYFTGRETHQWPRVQGRPVPCPLAGNCEHCYIGKFCCVLLLENDYTGPRPQARPSEGGGGTRPGLAQDAQAVTLAVFLATFGWAGEQKASRPLGISWLVMMVFAWNFTDAYRLLTPKLTAVKQAGSWLGN